MHSFLAALWQHALRITTPLIEGSVPKPQVRSASMRILVLQSGSTGNCIHVEAPGVRLLFDAGISGRQAERRLSVARLDPRKVNALLISHDHQDHARCLGIFHRKFGVPVYVTPRTLAAVDKRVKLGRITDIRHFEPGATIRFGGVSVEAIPTPHDGVDSVAFVVDDGYHRFGILTDLGHVFRGLERIIRSLDAVLLESNYAPNLLARSSYPEDLKERIRGPKGHLSNTESAQLLKVAGHRLKWACLGHLSEENNSPQVAVRTHRKILGDRFPLYVASRVRAIKVLEV